MIIATTMTTGPNIIPMDYDGLTVTVITTDYSPGIKEL